jgi:hypothetical protein
MGAMLSGVTDAHIRHLVAQDPSTLALADLPAGWQAWRSSPQAPFKRTRFDEDAD